MRSGSGPRVSLPFRSYYFPRTEVYRAWFLALQYFCNTQAYCTNWNIYCNSRWMRNVHHNAGRLCNIYCNARRLFNDYCSTGRLSNTYCNAQSQHNGNLSQNAATHFVMHFSQDKIADPVKCVIRNYFQKDSKKKLSSCSSLLKSMVNVDSEK